MAAILFEVAGTRTMNLSEGFTKLLPSTLIFLFYGLSLTALKVGSPLLIVGGVVGLNLSGAG